MTMLVRVQMLDSQSQSSIPLAESRNCSSLTFLKTAVDDVDPLLKMFGVEVLLRSISIYIIALLFPILNFLQSFQDDTSPQLVSSFSDNFFAIICS